MVSRFKHVSCTALKVAFAEKLRVWLWKCLIFIEGNKINTHKCIIKFHFWTEWLLKPPKGPLDFTVSLDVMCHLATSSFILLQLGTVRSILVQHFIEWKVCCKRSQLSKLKQVTNRHNRIRSGQIINAVFPPRKSNFFTLLPSRMKLMTISQHSHHIVGRW